MTETSRGSAGRGHVRIVAAGLNAHRQLLDSQPDDLTSFQKIHEGDGSDFNVWFASWSNTILATDVGLRGIGHQKVLDSSKVVLVSPVGDHNGVLLALDSDGQLYRVEEQTEQGIVAMVCQSTDLSPAIGRLAYAENGRVAITIKQAPNGNLCHVEEFKDLETFLRWFQDPSGDGNYPERHFMLPGRTKQLEAGTGIFVLLMESGQVYTWGDSRYRSLGRSVTGDGNKSADEPAVLEALDGLHIKKVDCCGWMSAALSDDGALYLWGITSPSDDVKIRALAAGEDEEVALVELPGGDSEPLDVVDVALGVEHIAVLAESGRLFVTGDNSCGQLGLGDKHKSTECWQEVTLPSVEIEAVYCGPRSTFALVHSSPA
ncbi:RCC1/BLIP-II protein [Zymoseptoria brevis]|uniref:RCC1/BLIP-II protein n=1 Tax=Zymoseptoria brevis TaxID=1047168 RepID=A0A0F4GVD1_9PEZI|nr:RCC1/BLIP-II protein [Zymoseptoria brevis]